VKIMKTFKSQRGFTLAELVVAVAMVAFVMAGTFVALEQGQNAYEFAAGRIEVQQSARVGVDRMIRDLRTGSAVIAAIPASILFRYIDEGGATVTVQYSLNGTNLERNQTSPVPATPQPETILGNVVSMALTYYDKNNVTTAMPANITVVDIQIRTRPQDTTLASYSMANQRTSFEDRVRLRNL
jgi:prepilin-type N-terminal cleavage/methylation domain-containing protein